MTEDYSIPYLPEELKNQNQNLDRSGLIRRLKAMPGISGGFRRVSSEEMELAIHEGVKRNIKKYQDILPPYLFNEHTTGEKPLDDLLSLERNTVHLLPPHA